MNSDLTEDVYHSLFYYGLDGVLLTAPDGEILAANPAACEMLGRTEEEICKAGQSGIVDVSDPRFATMLEERARTGHVRAELTFIRTDDTRFPAEISSAIFKDREGSSRTAMIIRDVTERKQSEEALRKSKHLYDFLVSRIPVGIYLLRSMPDESFALDYVSPRMAGMLNLSVESLLENAKAVFQAIHPDDRQGFVDLNLEGIQQIRPFDWTGRFPATGTVKWLHFSSSPETQEDGTILWFGIVTDVTERKQMEEMLKGREIELSTIIETEPECVKQLAADGTLLQMNRAGLNMIEADALDQVRGQKVTQLVMPEHRDAFMALTTRVFTGESGSMVFKIQGLKGSQRWLETHAVPLRNAQGKIISLLGVTRDITERKEMEDEIRHLAFYDPLTELPNRRLLFDRLGLTMSLTKRSGCHGAVIFLDLDNFKPLNDSYGHEAGDLLLIEVANRLKSCVRETDTIGRFGGDEFVVILGELNTSKDASTTQARMVAEKILITLSDPYRLAIYQEGKTDVTIEHRCTASIGMILFMGHEVSQNDILRRADSAMYQAKAAGRNKILLS